MYALFKRFLDLLIAIPGTLFTGLAAFPIGIAIKLGSNGPVFFRQTRVGKDGKPFHLLKFRTMVIDVHMTQEERDRLNETTGPIFKMRADPRITSAGRFLRKYSLDELPQFWNVLMGDMSLVGPRPPLAHEVKTYSEREKGRLSVKQGLTGLWQVNGRSNLNFEAMINLDLHYVRNPSLRLDLIILLKTIPTVLRGRGAY